MRSIIRPAVVLSGCLVALFACERAESDQESRSESEEDANADEERTKTSEGEESEKRDPRQAENCRKIRTTKDIDADGDMEYRMEFDYDDGKRVEKKKHDLRADEVAERWTYRYGDQGRRTRTEHYIDPDGDPKVVTTYEHESGHLVREEVDGSIEAAMAAVSTKQKGLGDPDGEPDEVVTYTYENEHRVEKAVDDDADGEPELVENFDYDDEGRRTRRTRNYSRDNKVDRVTTFDYDDNGNLVREEMHNASEAEGEATTVDTYEYDESGRLVRKLYDGEPDGDPDRITTYSYHDNGTRVREERDDDSEGPPRADGEVDEIWVHTFECD